MMPAIVRDGAACYMRWTTTGPPKAGKTAGSVSFPAPLYVSLAAEGGHETLRVGSGYLVPVAVVGQQHEPWMAGQGGVDFRTELDSLLGQLHLDCVNGRCPFQTLVIGSFTQMQQLVRRTIWEKHPPKDTKGQIDTQRCWGRVLEWATSFFQRLFSLPLHVVVEVACKTIYDRDGDPKGYDLGIQGQTYDLLKFESALMTFSEPGYPAPRTHFVPSMKWSEVFTRYAAFRGLEPIYGFGYDQIAQLLGLPPIWVCDPNHPRVVNGQWWPFLGQWPRV